MAAPYAGRGTWLGWGKETTWGTPVTIAKFAQAVSSDMQRRLKREPIGHLVQADDACIQDDFVASEEAGGNFELVSRYAHLGYLREAALGSVSTAADTPSVGLYTHTFSTSTDLVALTIERFLGNSGNSEKFTGCSIGNYELSVETAGYASEKFEVIAKTAASIASASTPTAPTAGVVLHSEAGKLTHNSVEYTATSFTVSLNNARDRLQELGSNYTSEPPISNFREPLIKARLAYRSDTLYSDHLAETQAAGSFAFTSGSNVVTVAWPSTSIVKSRSLGITSAGVLYEDIEIIPRGSGSTAALTVTVVNAEANYYD